MKTADINFSALKHYSTLFRIFIWMKRIRMIVLRVLLLVLLLVPLYAIYFANDGEFESSGTYSLSFNPLWLIVVWFVTNVLLIIWMAIFWRRFASDNPELKNLEPKASPDDHSISMAAGYEVKQMTVPSFRGKKLRMSLYPIAGTLLDVPFGIFTRTYKEGGLIRWRERKMDTIIWITLPKSFPAIVIDARANEQARRSNLTKRFDDSWKFQFEGSHGQHYNVYASPQDRVTALQLFTPDVLDLLYAAMPEMDIEVNGDTMWFIKRYGILDDVLAREMFSAVERLWPELSKQIEVFRPIK
jgi:hypothetical protein